MCTFAIPRWWKFAHFGGIYLLKLDALQEKKVKTILKKDKDFYQKLIDENTKDPLGYFRKSLKFNPQVGNGIVSLIAALAPLISSLILRWE